MGKQEVERDSGALRVDNVTLLIGDDLTRIRRLWGSSFAVFGDMSTVDEPTLRAAVYELLRKARRFRLPPTQVVEGPYDDLAEVATSHPELGWGPWPEPTLREPELWPQVEFLMGHFKRDRRFVARLRKLREFSTMAEYKWYLLEAMTLVDQLQGWSREQIEREISYDVSRRPPLDDLVRYRKTVLALARDFGLRCRWSPEYIHELAQHAREPERFILTIGAQLLLPLAIYVTDETKWGDVKKAVKTQLGDRKAEIVSAMDEVAQRIKRRTEFPLDELHIKWLYQRLALRWKYARIWLDHEGKHRALDAGYLDEAATGGPVGPAVRKVARRLGIKLLRMRGT